MIKIPAEYLAQMGEYSIKIEGAQVKVKVVHIDSPSIVNTHITEMRSEVMKSTGPRVVGVDVKHLNTDNNNTQGWGSSNFSIRLQPTSLVLCVGANCLIVCLPPEAYEYSGDKDATEELMEFLQDNTICFVGSTERPSLVESASSWGVEAGDLAATVLKRATLIKSTLGEIAREVGVRYEGPSNGTGKSLTIAAVNPIVFSEGQVKSAVSDAYAYYQIGHKLLSSI